MIEAGSEIVSQAPTPFHHDPVAAALGFLRARSPHRWVTLEGMTLTPRDPEPARGG